LCGGCHVSSTGKIGLFKIKSESAIAAGVRRIEAFTGESAVKYTDQLISELDSIRALFKNSVDTPRQVAELIEANKNFEKQLNQLKLEKAVALKDDLIKEFIEIEAYRVLTANLGDIDINDAKTLAYAINQKVPNSIILFATSTEDKVNLLLLIDKEIASDTLNAGKMIKAVAKHIQGGGGGQTFFATAGGKNVDGIAGAFSELLSLLK
jgi:alanyl-tRNA synthetase